MSEQPNAPYGDDEMNEQVNDEFNDIAARELSDLAEVRELRPRTESDADDQDDEHDGDGHPDQESVVIELGKPAGRPVDPPDESVPPGPALPDREREPVLPAWLASRTRLFQQVRWAVRYAGYVAAYHAVRSPKYAAKLAVFAPVGVVATVVRLCRWASAEEGNWTLRNEAANRNDPEAWLRLDRARERHTRFRWCVLLAGTVAATVGVLYVVYGPVPAYAKWLLVAALVPVLARLGRPADRPITDRVSAGRRYRKLTAELVRRALCSISIAGITQAVAKDPAAMTFPHEIRRDGPGYRAVVDLPFGVSAAEVIARRSKVAAGLRLPTDQVWPAPGTDHAGQLELWVGDEPASRMKQPAWPLTRSGKVDVFKSFPFATTPRLSTVNAQVMARNWLFGGVPGSGKTFAMRVVVLAAALDARCELRGYELKGTGDYDMVEPLCAEYGSGADDETALRALGLLRWLYAECQRRGPIVKRMAKAGKAPENKVTSELASMKGLGLHPILAWIDECQELFTHPDRKIRAEAQELAPKVIKLGRAYGIMLLLGTQRPDKDSLPTAVTANANTRFCLAVMDQGANDMILGTSAYKSGYRATQFEPGTDAGWGWAVGLGRPAPMRSYYVDNTAARKVIARATGYRQHAGTLPVEPERRSTDAGVDVLADLAAVWPVGEDKVWNEALCARLAELRPATYDGWRSEQLTSAVKPHGIRAADVGRRIDGKPVTRRGIARADLDSAIAERNRRRESDT